MYFDRDALDVEKGVCNHVGESGNNPKKLKYHLAHG